MLKYIKINNFLAMKIYINNYVNKLFDVKVVRLGISFLNQPFFKIFDPSNDELHQRYF